MTIEDILASLADGSMTQQEAAQALHDLVAEAVHQKARRDAFAMAAMAGLLSTGIRRPSMGEVAKECFAYAEEMVAAGKQP